MKKRHVEIAGAGIAGLAAAVAFAQRGWTVSVHERSPAVRGEGAGIYLSENGIRVLEALGVADAALAGCHNGYLRDTRDEKNRLLARVPLGRERSLRLVSVVRLQLLQALTAAAQRAGANIEHGTAAVSATSDGVLMLADGRQLAAELVIAADGINSSIRDSLGLLERRKRFADGANRFLIPRLPEEQTSEAGRTYTEYWSGFRRILYTPCSQGDLYLALTSLNDDVEGTAVPVRKDVWKKSFPHLHAVIDRIAGQGEWHSFEEVHLSRWSSGRVAIVGDAAHAQAPNLGQGGGCSLMNALGLAVATTEVADALAALELWEERERPLTEHTQFVSGLYSKLTTWPNSVRSIILKAVDRSQWAMRQRMRTARHVPTGTTGAKQTSITG